MMLLGTAAGIVLGLVNQSQLKPLKLFVRAYVYFVRGTSALVRVSLVYFALPVIGIEIPPF